MSDSNESPSEVMHSDDTLWGRYPSIFTRKNLVRAAGLCAALTFGLIVAEAYRIESYLGERKEVSERRNAEQIARDKQIACAFVLGKPDGTNDAVKDLRKRYSCPAYAVPGSSAPAQPTTAPRTKSGASSDAPRPRRTIGAPSQAPQASVAAPSVVIRTIEGRGGAPTTLIVSVPASAPTSGANGGRVQASPNPILCYPLSLPIAIGCPTR